MSKCHIARVTGPSPVPKWLPQLVDPAANRAVFEILCGELTEELRRNDDYATRWLLSRGYIVSHGSPTLPIVATITVEGAEIGLTRQQASQVEKALNKETNEDKRYASAALLIDRLTSADDRSEDNSKSSI